MSISGRETERAEEICFLADRLNEALGIIVEAAAEDWARLTGGTGTCHVEEWREVVYIVNYLPYLGRAHIFVAVRRTA